VRHLVRLDPAPGRRVQFALFERPLPAPVSRILYALWRETLGWG